VKSLAFKFAAAATVAIAALGASAAQAEDAKAYPSRGVKVMVAFQAGQGSDTVTRFIADELTRAMGQTFYVENKPGAGGNLGTSLALSAPPDGYTLYMGTAGTQAMNPHMYKLGFNPIEDFEPIALIGMIPMAISVSMDFPAKNLKELLDAARAKPDSINVALPSTTSRLVSQMLRQKAGVSLYDILYKGSATALPEVISGRVPVLIDTIAATKAQAGKTLKPLAITSAKSSALLPGVPSVMEQGVPEFEMTAWNMLVAPKGTPPEILDRLSKELQNILSRPDTTAKLATLGLDPAPMLDRAGVDRFARSESDKFGQLIKDAKIEVQ